MSCIISPKNDKIHPRPKKIRKGANWMKERKGLLYE